MLLRLLKKQSPKMTFNRNSLICDSSKKSYLSFILTYVHALLRNVGLFGRIGQRLRCKKVLPEENRHQIDF